MMKVNHISLDGTETNTYLIGYTEYDGIAPNGHIDMNMPHYINNVIETTRRIARGFRNFENYRLRILASASGQRPYRQPPKPVKQGQPNHAE